MSSSPASLTDRMKRFVEEYTGPSKLNATRAAIASGYAENSASESGYENLRKPQIRDAIAKRLEQYSMPVAEATERMAQFARGSLAPFLTADGHVDLLTEEAQYNLHLFKKVKVMTRYSEDGGKLSESVEIELHDVLYALDKVLRMHAQDAWCLPPGAASGNVRSH